MDATSQDNVDDHKKELLKPRAYQSELLEAALRSNTIICLNTGSGKTFIAVMLIKKLQHEILPKPLDQGGKKTFFLVNTVPLARQQSDVLRKQTPFKVGDYVGDDVDLWNKTKWVYELDSQQVLVMTADILAQILQHGYIKVSQINLLIFDECHHAVGNHTYVQIMRDYVYKEQKSKPRIFGMTASVFHGKCRIGQIENKIRSLEAILLSRVVTTSYRQDLVKYSTKAEEMLIPYAINLLDNHRHKLREVISSIRNIEDWISSLPSQNKRIVDYNMNDTSSKKVLEGYVKDFKATYEGLGGYGLYLIINSVINELVKVINDPSKWKLYSLFLKKLYLIQKELQQAGLDHWESVYQQPKLFTLFNELHKLLSNLGDSRNFCAIIFTEKRCVAYALSSILDKVAEHDNAFSCIKSDFVVGHGTRVSSSLVATNMSHNQQTRAINKFRRQDVNILVATNVLEEGIDVPKCNLVVRFDEIKTFGSYLQAKGRARAQHAHYIILVEKDKIADARDQFSTWSYLERYLQDQRQCRAVGTEEDYLADDSLNLVPPYEVESTGAKVTMSNSVQLLHWYCSTLPQDEYSVPEPVITFNKSFMMPGKIKATIQLPSSSPLPDSITGPLAITEKRAKASTALLVCQELHEIGQLDDNLVPVKYLQSESFSKNVSFDDDSDNSIDNKATVEDAIGKKEVSYPQKIPAVLNDCHPKEKQDLYLYALVMKALPPYKAVNIFDKVNFGIILSHKLPELPCFNLYTSYGAIEASIKLSCRRKMVTSEQLLQIHFFNKKICTFAFRINRDDLRYNARFSISGYMLIPIIVNSTTGNDFDADIDYKYIDEIIKYRQHYVEIDCTKLDMLNDALVVQNYGDYPGMYEIREICRHRSPEDNMQGDDDCDKNFMTYYKERYHITIKDPKQPLLLVKKISKRRNMLRSNTDAKSVDISNESYMSDDEIQLTSTSNIPITDKQSETSSKITELIPELCKRYFLSASVWKVITCIPSFLWRMETLLLAHELKDVLFGSIPINGISISKNQTFTLKLLEALTLAEAEDDINLERLEFLGDSFLKFIIAANLFISHPKYHEGQLTNELTKIVRNDNLLKLGKSTPICEYIIGKPFNLLKNEGWIPPGYKLLSSKVKNLDEKVTSDLDGDKAVTHQKFSSKSIADVMKAILAAILLEFDERHAKYFISWLDKDIKFTINASAASLLPDDDDISSNEINKIYEANNLERLEKVIGYSFQNKLFMIRALTHSSYHHHNIAIESNQKLEFLGDTILQYIIARHFFNSHPDAKPAKLHDFQEAIVNNKCLAVIGIAIGVSKYVFQESPDLFRDIDQFAKIITCDYMIDDEMNYNDRTEALFENFTEEVKIPKPVSDVVEALIGAIYIDTGESIAEVTKALMPLLQPRISLVLRDIPISPIRQLYEKVPEGVSFVKKGIDGLSHTISSSLANGKEYEAKATNFKQAKNIISETAPADLGNRGQ
ncbi:Endoribonuclease Dicer [Trichoplax sp. H2]|nr:Endoribonuclease Dicer [Trichoplax sp. H2]|eukprot:RDD42015.1 Endoribonuclease Dicer [Trichoplax sp. H2]